MPFDAFLKFDAAAKIEGEVVAEPFAKALDIYSFSWGASNPATPGNNGGLSAGKASLSGFNIMKKTDKASAALFQACVSGKHIPNATVSLRKAGGDGGQKVFLKYVFTNVLIESIQWSGSSGGDDTPTESVSLAYEKVEIEYSTQAKDGSTTLAGQASWDVKTVSK